MATFVIHLYRLEEDLLSLSEQIQIHKNNLLSQRKRIENHNLDKLNDEIKNFKTIFDNLIDEEGKNKRIDIYGSEYRKHSDYRYAEVTYENQARIKIIRLLGSTGVTPVRFFISNVKNPFSITTLKFISDIRELVKKTDSLLDIILKCDEKGDFSHDMDALYSPFSKKQETQKYKYDWSKFEQYFVPKIKYVQDEKMTDEEIQKRISENQEKTKFSKEELEKHLVQVESEKIALLENRAKKTIKAPDQVKELSELLEKQKKLTSAEQEEENKKRASAIIDWLDRHTIGCLIQEAVNCIRPANVTCKDTLSMLTPGEIFDRLSLVFPKGSDTFQELEKAVEKSLYEGTRIPELKTVIAALETSIKEDQILLSELKNIRDTSFPVEQKIADGISSLEEKIRIYNSDLQQKKQELQTALSNFSSDLKLSDQQAIEIKNGGGNIAAIFSLPTETEQIGTNPITGKIIAAIDTIVPLEDLCEAIISSISNGFLALDFQFPKTKKPDDIFAGFSSTISNLVLTLIIEAIVGFLETILQDLINCDNLDNLISKMVNSSMTSQEINLLNQLFGGDSAEQIVKDNYEKFVSTFSRNASKDTQNPFDKTKTNIISEADIKAILTPNMDFREGVTNKQDLLQEAGLTLIDLAEASGKTQAQIDQDIFGSGEYVRNLFNKGNTPEANWMIDITGNKFEIIDGIKIIDLQEIDKLVTSLSQDASDAISQNANITRKALIDAFGQVETQAPTNILTSVSQKEIALVLSTDDKENIKNELMCIMKNIISLLSPSQTLSLFAGTATSEVVLLAAHIVKMCAPSLKLIFADENRIANMFGIFGNIAGLDNMSDSIQLLASSEEFKQLAVQPERCGPFNSVEEFREQLLLNTLSESEVNQILEETRKEREQKFREVGNSLIDMANGGLPEPSSRNPNKFVLDAIKAAIDRQEMPRSAPASLARKSETFTNKISSAIEKEFNDSPVVKNIYKRVVNSLFTPIDNTFRSDMDGFIDAFSDIIQKEEVVEREIEISVEGRKIKIINPLFKEMLDSNLIPSLQYKNGPKEKKEKYAKMVDKSNFDVLKIGDGEGAFQIIQDRQASGEKTALYVSGEPSKNYLEKGLNGVPIKPVLKKNNKKDVGASFKRNIQNIQTNSSFANNILKIYVSGALSNIEDSFMSQVQANVPLSPEMAVILTSLKQNNPSWSIGFEEFERTGVVFNKISLNSSGYMPSSGKIDPFYLQSPFETQSISRPVKDIQRFLTEKYDTTNKKRKEVFDNILFENIKYYISSREDRNIEQRFAQNSIELYNKLITAFLNGSTSSILKTKLLVDNQEIKNKTGQSIKNIEAIKFSSKCETILDFDSLKAEYRRIYEILEEPLVTERQRMGLEPRPSKSKKTGLMLMSKILIRLLCFETLIKSLPAFEYFKYSSSLVNNDMMINLVCKFIETELSRLQIKTEMFKNIRDYYNIKRETNPDEYEQITDEDKLQTTSFPVEMKKIVQKEFQNLLIKIKQITRTEEQLGLSDADDFIRPILDTFKVFNVHSNNGIIDYEIKDLFFSSQNVDKEFVLERYIRLPDINRQSQIVIGNPQYFTNEKIQSLEKNKVVNFEQASQIFSEILYSIGYNYSIFNCDSNTYSLYSEPIRFGLRIVYVDKKTQSSTQTPDPNFQIGQEKYPFLFENCEQEKLGFIVERTIDTDNQIDYNIEYNSIKIAQEEIKMNENDDAQSFINRNNENRYIQEFYVRLKKGLLNNTDMNLIFAFSLPLKEIASMLILHTNLANNNYKMKYFLETTKGTITNITNTLLKMGDMTGNNIDAIIQKNREATNNMGNPAGPTDPDAFKMYIRTPIQILKSLATIVDPNIGLADKINSGISLAGSMVGQKTYIPYFALSLGLLPAPIFGGLIPYIAPLTTYNLAPPLGQAFLFLEPLLWDLPWYKDAVKTQTEENIECEDTE